MKVVGRISVGKLVRKPFSVLEASEFTELVHKTLRLVRARVDRLVDVKGLIYDMVKHETR